MSRSHGLMLITGGSSGIGAEMAQYLGQNGWDIAFTYAGNKVGAENVASVIESLGQKAYFGKCDVGIKSDVDHFFQAVEECLGVPDVLVNNAGVQTWSSLIDLDEDSWDNTIRTNLKGTFLCTQKYAKMVRDSGRKGAIINIGSGCNKVPFPNLVDYSASKGGIEMLTRVSATELGNYGIRVNCVAPGAIEIERTREEAPDYAKIWSAQAPLGRVGFSEDVARAVEYFSLEGSSFVTGQTLYVDGGVFTMPNWPKEAYSKD